MDVVTKAKQRIGEWRRGQTSEHHETGGRGPGTVSTGRGDHGGVSYGTYQFATNVGGASEYVARSAYGARFTGLEPGTPAFSERWREVAAADPQGFAKDQHDFIQAKYYDVQLGRLKDVGIDLSGRGPAVQDALWSTSVQYRGLTRSVFRKGLEEAHGKDYRLSDLTDEQIVRAVQDYKHAKVHRHFESSPRQWEGLRNRTLEEKDALIGLARYDQVNRHPERYQGLSYPQVFGEPEPIRRARPPSMPAPMADGMLTVGERGAEVEALQKKLIRGGYTGKDGQPLIADRHFGPNTEYAVRAFQQANGLAVDGKVGRHTLSQLERIAEARAAGSSAVSDVQQAQRAAPASAAAAGVSQRIVLMEPFGNGRSNRTIEHGTSGEDAYRELKIHHPNTNAEAVRTGDASKADRPSTFIEGELETVRTRGDRNGIPLVHKDLILANSRGDRDLMIPNPVAGYVQVNQDKWNSISIYSHPAGHPERELIGQVLHGKRGTTTYRSGDFVEYGAPLIRQSDAGTPGAVHAHIELEPEQFRRYMGDILNDRITLAGPTCGQDVSSRNATGRAAMDDGMLTHGERGAAVGALQEKLAALGHHGRNGQPLVVDRYFGANTEYAVREFQRHHGLKEDGKAAPRTLEKLEAAASRANTPKSKASDMRDAGHPDNARFTQAMEKLQLLEQQRLQGGMDPLYPDGVLAERVAAQLVVASRSSGLQRVDTVVARLDGTGVFAVQGTPGDPAAHRVFVEHRQAQAHTVEDSTREAERLNAGVQQQVEAQQRQHAQSHGI